MELRVDIIKVVNMKGRSRKDFGECLYFGEYMEALCGSGVGRLWSGKNNPKNPNGCISL